MNKVRTLIVMALAAGVLASCGGGAVIENAQQEFLSADSLRKANLTRDMQAQSDKIYANYVEVESLEAKLKKAHGAEAERIKAEIARIDRRDSLQNGYTDIQNFYAAQLRDLSVKYGAYSEKALDQVIRSRFFITRQDLKSVVKNMTPELKKSENGMALAKYVKKKQLLLGDKMKEFSATNINNGVFDWKQTEGKQILLIFEGWGYMKPEKREYLLSLLGPEYKDNLIVLGYVYGENYNDFVKRAKKFKCEDFTLLSDLTGRDGGPVKEYLGVSGVPTVFITDRNHVVIGEAKGVEPDFIRPLIGK